MGSLLITCYLIYFAYFAYTVFDEINTQQTAAFGGATTSGHFHRDESYFELKNERHVTPGKDFAIDTANITQLEEYRAFNPAVHFYKGSTFMIIRHAGLLLLFLTVKHANPIFGNRCDKIEFFGEGRQSKLQKWEARVEKK